MTNTPVLNAPEIAQNQGAAVTANEANRFFDSHIYCAVINSTTNAPPGSPADGDMYRIGASPSGDWLSPVSYALGFAFYLNGAWKKTLPKEGMTYWDKATDKRFRYDGSAWKEVALQQTLSKTFSILNPTTSENLTLGYFTNAATIRRITVVVRGTSPSRTWTLRKASDRSAGGTEVVTSGTVTTNSTSGAVITSFTSATIPAGNFLWFTTTAGSGTVTEISVTIEYTED